MRAGHDYIGVGVGAIVFNQEGLVFLAKRGPGARNEQGYWEFPGGGVDFGEKLIDAVTREFREEYGMDIEVIALLGVTDHILEDGREHWISPTYIARHIGGTSVIREPEKCTEIDWFSLDHLPEPRSLITEDNLRTYYAMYGFRASW